MSQSPPQSRTKLTLFQRLFFLGSKPGGPKWDPKSKRFQTQWLARLVLVLVITTTAAVIYWVAIQKIEPATVKQLPAGADLAVVLAPVLAAAAGIERFLETIFGIIEGNWRTLVAYLGRGMRWLQNAEAEVDSARQWLAGVAGEYNRQLKDLSFSSAPAATTTAPPAGQPDTPPADAATQPAAPNPPASTPQGAEQVVKLAQQKLEAAQGLMDLAEARLRTAEAQLSQVTSSDSYKNAKRAASIYLGLLLGLVVATASSLQMFAMMGVQVGHPRVDVIITGLVIGSGSAPVHSLINILQSAKDTLDSTKGWLDSKKKTG